MKRDNNDSGAFASHVAVSIGLAMYARMVRLSHDSNQTVGEKRDYYVTLEQLEWAYVSLRDELTGAAPTETATALGSGQELRERIEMLPEAEELCGAMPSGKRKIAGCVRRDDVRAALALPLAPKVPATSKKITSAQLQVLARDSKTCFDGGNHLFWQNLADKLNEYFMVRLERDGGK